MMQLTSEQIKELYDTKFWKKWKPKEIFLFQISQQYCCIEWTDFLKATNKVLKRPVYTHEFVNPIDLFLEYIGQSPKRSIVDIIKKAQEVVGGEGKLIIVCDKDG